MKITLRTGQQLEILSIVPTGSHRRGLQSSSSDMDLIVIFKWCNYGEVLGKFPVHLSKGDRNHENTIIYQELMHNKHLCYYFGDFSNLDVKFEEVSTFVSNIRNKQTLEGLEVISCNSPLYKTPMWENVSILQYELFNKAHYLNTLLRRIKSTFNKHFSKDLGIKYKNLANVLYLVYLYQKQTLSPKDKVNKKINTDIFIDKLDEDELYLVRQLKFDSNNKLYQDTVKYVEEFISNTTLPSYQISMIEPYNTWLSVVHGAESFNLNYTYSSAISRFEYDLVGQELTVSWGDPTKGWQYFVDKKELLEMLSWGSLGRACRTLSNGTPIHLGENS